MSGNWQEITLGEALEINPSIQMPKNVPLPFVDMQALESGKRTVFSKQTRVFSGGGARFVSGDTLMARITPCLENGKIARYKAYNDKNLAHGSTEFIVLRNKHGITHDRFIYYLTISDFVKPKAISQMTGSSGRQRVPTDALKRITIQLPSLEEQKSISDVLEIIDDKIELNRQMNETLEGTAQALFRSWFVDFDPVRAKMEGKKPEGLSDDLAVLFPSKIDGGIPSGWREDSIYSCAKFINGAAYKNMHFFDAEDALPVIKIAELKAGIGQGTKFTNTDLGRKYLIDSGDILFSWSGSPETSIDTFLWVGGKGWLNQHIFKVVTDSAEMRTFTFFLLKHLKPIFVATAKDKQTTGLGHVTVQDLKRLKAVYPDQRVLKAFSEVATPLLGRIQKNMEQIADLNKIRDSLLPKLISGELRVSDAADFLNEKKSR
jgi:type I restriction enzyme S subunit